MRGDSLARRRGCITAARQGLLKPVGKTWLAPDEAGAAIDAATLQMVAFGHHYVSNPDSGKRRFNGDSGGTQPATFYSPAPDIPIILRLSERRFRVP